MLFSLAKSRLFALDGLVSLLESTLSTLASKVAPRLLPGPLSKTAMMGVSPLKAANRIKCGNDPINFVDPDGLDPALSPAVQEAYGAEFVNTFNEGLAKARERWNNQGYEPFEGFPLEYVDGLPGGHSPTSTQCQFDPSIDYEDLLNGNWEIIFDLPSPEVDGENFVMRSTSKDQVLINSFAPATIGTNSDYLGDLILHELTHIGISRNYGNDYEGSVIEVHSSPAFSYGVDAMPVR